MEKGDGGGKPQKMSPYAFPEYDRETIERVHQENIRKSKLALEQATQNIDATATDSGPQSHGNFTWKAAKPRTVSNSEISPYQGMGGKKQMQRAQSRKRRQVRRREASIWDSIAPKELHSLLNVMLWAIFLLGLAFVFALNF